MYPPPPMSGILNYFKTGFEVMKKFLKIIESF